MDILRKSPNIFSLFDNNTIKEIDHQIQRHRKKSKPLIRKFLSKVKRIHEIWDVHYEYKLCGEWISANQRYILKNMNNRLSDVYQSIVRGYRIVKNINLFRLIIIYLDVLLDIAETFPEIAIAESDRVLDLVGDPP